MLLLSFGLFYAAFFISIGILLAWSQKRPKNYPPGPLSWGYLGHFPHFMAKDPREYLPLLMAFVARYKTAFQFNLGPLRNVNISDLEVMKEAFRRAEVCGRLDFEPLKLYRGNRGLAMNSGEAAMEIKRFTANKLKDFGIGQSSLGPMLADEANDLISALRQKVNVPMSTAAFFNLASFNVLWRAISGEKVASRDPKVENFMTGVSKINSSYILAQTAMAFPGLWKWVPFHWRTEIRTLIRNMENLFVGFVRTRRLKYVVGAEQDFTDAFINQIHNTTNPSSAFYGEAGYENLAETIKDLFLGGIETTGTILSWTCLYLALHPEKQVKVQQEIDEVLQGQTPCLSDKKRLPYLMAVISETLRKASVLPLGLPHMTTADTTIGGYNVPKNTMVNAFIYGIHHCPETWKDPENFRPERFLALDGKSRVKHEALVPFSLGRRSCPGEKLSMDNLLIFITRIFQEFSVSLNPEEPRPSMDTKLTVVLMPLPHTLIFTERRSNMKIPT